MLNDVLFFASVLTFAAAAVLGKWQLLRAEAEEMADPVAAPAEPERMPDPIPAGI